MRRYFVLSKTYVWEGPFEANSASHAVELFIAGGKADDKLDFRIVKVATSGELIELKRRGRVYEPVNPPSLHVVEHPVP